MVIKEKTNILICGYLGFDNLGDEITLQAILHELKDENLNIKVLSANPYKTYIQHGVNSINRWKVLSVINAIWKSDVVMFIGGLFQDITSSFSLYYYLSLIIISKLLNRKVVFYSVGIGPIIRNLNRSIFRTVSRYVDIITVRDNYSSNFFLQEKPVITADPAFTLPISPVKNLSSQKVGVCLKKNKKILTLELLKILRYRFNLPVELVCFNKADLTYLLEIAEIYGLNVVKLNDFNDVYKVMPNYMFFISQRLHPLIISFLYGIPFIGLSENTMKVSSFLQEVNLNGLYIANEDEISGIVRSVIENIDGLKFLLTKKSIELKKKSSMNKSKFLTSL